MALTQAAALAEKALGHRDNAITEQDITNPGRDRKKYADPSGKTMKALCWMGKNNVKVCEYYCHVLRLDNWLTHQSGCPSAQSCGRHRCHSESHRKYRLWQ